MLFVQGIGASSVLSVGAGSIGDIYLPTECGKAMALYLTVSCSFGALEDASNSSIFMRAQLGTPLSPVIGGILTEYDCHAISCIIFLTLHFQIRAQLSWHMAGFSILNRRHGSFDSPVCNFHFA